ncbi:Endonuclease/exonuclease/phosphatase [Neurospora crassa]|nr:Endonuclease/exonuclease/phosphatase [Neurospora crassa]
MKFTAATLLAQGALAAAATSGDFTILTMNVAGLPEVLNPNGVPGGKEASSKTIGSRFAQYGFDVIHVQEDFNYHAALYSTDTHPYRTPTSGGVPFGSGLNTLSNFPWLSGSFQRQKWAKSSCASEFDCLTPKGFTFMRVALSSSSDATDAVYVDFYNMHTDAGTETADLEARNDNLRQVGEWIQTHSQGNAVLVFGDTNSRYSRSGDTGIRSLLKSENPTGAAGLQDIWVELHRNGVVPNDAGVCGNPAQDAACEIVDKVLYRSSPLVQLTPTALEYAGPRFLADDGASVLSDHNPVLVNLTWSAADRRFRQSGFWGGAAYGNWFNDVSVLDSTTGSIKTKKITFRGENRLDSVGLTVSSSSGQGTTELVHGGQGGSEVSLTLADGESWVKSELCQGQKSDKTRNFYIKATTSKGRTLEAGNRTSDCKVFEAEEGWQVVGFLGESGDEVDLLGFIYGKI